MILTPIRRYGAMILMLLTLVFSSEVLAKTHTTTASQKSHLTKASNKQVSSKQEYSRNSAKRVHFLICENTLPEHQGKRRFSGL